MKCIKSIRASKGVEVGDIKRVDDKTAMSMVGLSWQYISKTEWKLSRGKKVVEVNPNHETDRVLIDEAAAVSLNTAEKYQQDKEKKKKKNSK
jgi:hypothetical protein